MFISAPSFLVLSPISRQAKLISRNETAEPSAPLTACPTTLPPPVNCLLVPSPISRHEDVEASVFPSFFFGQHRRARFVRIWEFYIVRVRSNYSRIDADKEDIRIAWVFFQVYIPIFIDTPLYKLLIYREQRRTQDVNNYSTKIRVLEFRKEKKNGMEISINRRSIELILQIFMRQASREIIISVSPCLFCTFKNQE